MKKQQPKKYRQTEKLIIYLCKYKYGSMKIDITKF